MADVVLPDMNITLPAPLASPGPDYAIEVNEDLTLINSHNHTSGKGVLIPVAGLNIDADFPINQNNVDNARSYRFFQNGAGLNGASDINCIYDFAGDLWYNNSIGTPIQLTLGSSLNPASPIFLTHNISGNYPITSGTTFNYFDVTTASAALSITLPAVSSVASGRFYYIKDSGGNSQTNNITLVRDGSDTFNSAAGNLVLNTNLGGWLIVGNGVSNWDVFYTTTKVMMDGRFGTDIQNVLVQGSSASVKATGTNNVLIGGTLNSITIGGATTTVNSTTSVSILSPTINIGQSASAINVGTGGTGTLTINSGTSIFSFDLFVDGTTTLTGPSQVDGNMTVDGYLRVEHSCSIGLLHTDTCTINSDTLINNYCRFNGFVEFFGANVEFYGNTTMNNLIYANTIGNIVTSANGRFTGRRSARLAIATYANNSTDYTPAGTAGYDYVCIPKASVGVGGTVNWTIPAAPGTTSYINGDTITFAATGDTGWSTGTINIKDTGGSTIATLSSTQHESVTCLYSAGVWIYAPGL